ncbi:MAG: hypothetical protein ACE5GL_00850, partial [Calditrichia bacterium]
EAINRWLSKETGPPPAAHQIIDLKGLERLPGLIYGGQSPQNVTVPANSNQAPEEFSYVS